MGLVIEVRGVTKQYGSTRALSHIHLEVEEGKFLTLLGPSGCGKTTLLRIIAGFVEPTEGEVVLDGEVINGVPANRRPVGMLFQQYALFPHMTVEHNVSFGLRMRRESNIERKVDELLDLVEMREYRRRYPGQLSGGQQQRVALARTLAIEPRVLLLDEPLAALDRKLRLQMQVDLKMLIDRIGVTTICVTHDQDEALTMSDAIALMNNGAIIQYGPPMEIYDRPSSPFAAGFVGDANLFAGNLRTDPAGEVVFEAGPVRVLLGAAAGTCRDGPATLLVRPQHFRIALQPRASDDLAGTVRFVTHFGAVTEYDVQLEDGVSLKVETVRSSGLPPFDVGAKVYVGVANASACWVFPDLEGGQERFVPAARAETEQLRTAR